MCSGDKMKWINAREEFPDCDDAVLCYSENMGITICFYDSEDDRWYTSEQGIWQHVEYWMPLPEPPK